MKPLARWRWLVAVLVLMVSWLALTPKPPEGDPSQLDKLGHFAAFFALAACGLRAWPEQRFVLALLGWLAFGAAIEGAQLRIPGRSAEAADLLADALGIAVGWWAGRRWLRF